MNPNDWIEINRRIEKEAREEKDKGGGIVRSAKPGGGGKLVPVISGTAPIVDSEAGTAGTSTTDALAADTKPGNLLAGAPGDATDDTATLNPSLEYVKKTAGDRRGQRVKIGTTYVAGGPGEVADLTTKAATADPASASGLVIRLGANLKRDANGVALDDHKTSHQSGGADAIKLDDLSAPDDNTDLNASDAKHGLLPKLGGGTTNYLRADGAWAAPPGATLSTDTPTTITGGAGGAGSDTEGSKSDHSHPCTLTGASGWDTVGGAAAGKVYAVYK